MPHNTASLSLRRIILAVAFIVLGYSALSVPVLAQTVTIGKVDYPSAVVYGGSAIITIQAQIAYSGAGRGTDYVLTVTLLDREQNNTIRGNDVTLTATPIPCGGIQNYNPQGATFCPILPRSSNGSETVQFQFNTSHAALPPIWYLVLRAALGQADAPSPSTTALYNFTINVIPPQEAVTTLPGYTTASAETDTGTTDFATQISYYVGAVLIFGALMTVYSVWPRNRAPKARRRR